MNRARALSIAALIALGALIASWAALRTPARGAALDAPERREPQTALERASGVEAQEAPQRTLAPEFAREPASGPRTASLVGRATPAPGERAWPLRALLVDAQDRTVAIDVVTADGRFALEGLPAGAGFRLRVHDALGGPFTSQARLHRTPPQGLFVRGERDELVLRPGETTEVEVELRPPASVRGRVLGPEGEGLAELQLVAIPAGVEGDWDSIPNTTATTRAGGAFHFEELDAGRFELEVLLPNRSRQRFPLAPLAVGEAREGVELRLDARRTLAGRVLLPDGGPASGALVGLLQQDGPEGPGAAPRPVACDAEGRFRFGFLNTAKTTLGALLEQRGAGLRRERLVALWSGEPDGRELALRLAAEPVLRGRVLDERGQPLGSFTLKLECDEEHPALPPTQPFRSRFTSADGRFEIAGLLPGRWRLEARAYKHRELEGLELHLPAAPVELRLERLARLGGVVRDAAGAPVPRVAVVVGAPAEEPESRYDLSHLRGLHAFTDVEGRFRALHVPAGAVELHTKQEGHAGPPLRLVVAPGEEREDLELTLPPR